MLWAKHHQNWSTWTDHIISTSMKTISPAAECPSFPHSPCLYPHCPQSPSISCSPPPMPPFLRFCLSLFSDWFAFAQFHSPLSPSLCICSAAAQAPLTNVTRGFIMNDSSVGIPKPRMRYSLDFIVFKVASAEKIVTEYQFITAWKCTKMTFCCKFTRQWEILCLQWPGGRRFLISLHPGFSRRLHNLVRNRMTDNLRLEEREKRDISWLKFPNRWPPAGPTNVLTLSPSGIFQIR